MSKGTLPVPTCFSSIVKSAEIDVDALQELLAKTHISAALGVELVLGYNTSSFDGMHTKANYVRHYQLVSAEMVSVNMAGETRLLPKAASELETQITKLLPSNATSPMISIGRVRAFDRNTCLPL